MQAVANPNDALKNHLLAALPDDEFARVQSKLEPVSLILGEVLYESGDRLDCVYFPTTMIISMLYVMKNGSTAEIGVVGNDGLIGNALFMGGDTTTSRAVIQSAGEGAAQRLAVKKLIKNVRGTITVIDRQGLEEAVCECYEVVNTEYNRLLGRGISRSFGKSNLN